MNEILLNQQNNSIKEENENDSDFSNDSIESEENVIRKVEVDYDEDNQLKDSFCEDSFVNYRIDNNSLQSQIFMNKLDDQQYSINREITKSRRGF